MRVLRSLLITVAKVLVVLVVGVALAIVILRVLNPRPGDSVGWRESAAMPQGRGEVASAMVGKRLVVIGGLHGIASTSRSVHVYDARFDAWLPAPRLPEPRHHAAAATVDGIVYLAGGAASATDWTPADDVWGAEPGGRWRRVAAMPEGRQGHAMVALQDKLYVVGGVGRTDDTLIYDVTDERWTRGAPIPAGRDHLRAVEWNGEIWAIGGRAGAPTDRVDVYDPRRDRWTRGIDLPEPMSAMAVGVVRGQLHVIGGEDPRFFRGGVLSDHVQLDEGAERWEERPRQMLPVHGAGFGVFERSLIVAGGASRQGAMSVLSWTNVTQTYTVRPLREFQPD